MSASGWRGQGVVMDLETASADSLYTGDHAGPFVRLAGAQTLDGRHTYTGPAGDEFWDIVSGADFLVTHNGQAFDLPALARHYQRDIWPLACRTMDTLTLARLADPPGARGQKPWSVPGYYALDTLAGRLGLPGKTDDLPALAKEYGGYDRIPVDDARYNAYLRGDLAASGALYGALAPAIDAYAVREMKVAGIQSRLVLNGWRMNTALLEERVTAERERQAEAFAVLHDQYGMPERGRKNPLATKAGKAWFEAGLVHLGIPVPRTRTGGVSVSGDALKELRALPGLNPDAAIVLDLMLVCAGIMNKYQEIQARLIGDRLHQPIGAPQASGRWAQGSITNVGKRGAAKVAQRAPFLPEEGHVHLTVDLDQVDMRGIAALSQDPGYMALFGPGMDAHAMIAELVLGDRGQRESAKTIGHGWNYGEGPKKIAADKGIPLEVAQQFDRMMTERFPVLCEARQEWRAQGESGELLDNGFGRFMRCDPARAYTQAPALKGQGSARDLMCEGLLRLDPAVHPMLRAVVHDEIVMSVPREQVDEVRDHVVSALTWNWRGVPITAGASLPGENWADCYRKAA